MAYKDVAAFSSKMAIVCGLIVVGFMAFGLTFSYYKNILFDQQLLSMKQKNEDLNQSIVAGYDYVTYLDSVQFKDKYAKQNFGLLRPGEKVLLLVEDPKTPSALVSDEPTEEEKQALYEENLRSISIVDQWNLFLFHRDKISDLQKEG